LLTVGAALAQDPVTVTGDAEMPAQPMQTADAAAHGAQWTVAPYLWMVGMDGSVTVHNTQAEVDASFGDILANLDFALMAHVECELDKGGLFFDGFYSALSDDADVGAQSVELSSTLKLLEFGAFSRFLDRTLDASTDRHFKADALAGVRYYDLENRIDFDSAGLQSIDDGEWWVDSFVGARCQWDFARSFSLTARGDVGGFGFGTASDLAWQVQTLFCWQLSEGATLGAGYRVLDIDRAQDLDTDMQLHGPVLGVAFRF
jgi:hypothetical protein